MKAAIPGIFQNVKILKDKKLSQSFALSYAKFTKNFSITIVFFCDSAGFEYALFVHLNFVAVDVVACFDLNGVDVVSVTDFPCSFLMSF
jgi:hypothetical protein